MVMLSGAASVFAGVVLWAVTKSAPRPPPILEPRNHPLPGWATTDDSIPGMGRDRL